MSLHPMVCADASVAASQNAQVLEFFFVGAAPGANGAILSLIAAQSGAQHRVHLAVGGSAAVTAATPSAAVVEALIKRPNGNSLSATEENIKTGVLALLGEVEVAADGAECVAFAIGGLNARDVIAAELVVSSGAVQDSLVLAQTASAVRIPEPVALVSGKLKKADGSGADLDTDKLVLVGGELNGSCSTAVGCFTVAESDKLALSAANTVKLRLTVRN
jgi:hypothetical protein